MCEQCKAIDKRIEHYREMATHVIDQPTLDGISLLIAKLESDKKERTPSEADLAALQDRLLRATSAFRGNFGSPVSARSWPLLTSNAPQAALTRIVPTCPFFGLEPINPLCIDLAEDFMPRVWNTPVFILAAVYFVVDGVFSHLTQPITAWLAKKELFERVRLWVISLGPYPSLALFAVPVIILEPAKPLAGYLLGTGHFFAGAVTFITAEVLKLTLVEQLFQLNREKLLSIPVFAWGYQYWRHMMDVVESMEVWKASRRLAADAARMFRARWIQYKRVHRSSRLHYHP